MIKPRKTLFWTLFSTLLAWALNHFDIFDVTRVLKGALRGAEYFLQSLVEPVTETFPRWYWLLVGTGLAVGCSLVALGIGWLLGNGTKWVVLKVFRKQIFVGFAGWKLRNPFVRVVPPFTFVETPPDVKLREKTRHFYIKEYRGEVLRKMVLT